MSLLGLLTAILVGFVSGYLSGQLGIGGGILTTPAIRLILGYPAYVAVGTPLLVIIPTTLVASVQYARENLVDRPLARRAMVAGLPGVLVGAYMTKFIPGGIILIVTSGVMMASAVRMADRRKKPEERAAGADHPVLVYGTGLAAGLASGFLGLGGGMVLIPAFVALLGRSVKVAFGTSLVVVCAFAVPGAVVHWLLGHVDVGLAALLVAGVVPGAWLGARVAIRAREAALRLAFAVFLALFAVAMAASEIVRML